jgi:hypothetical protein
MEKHEKKGLTFKKKQNSWWFCCRGCVHTSTRNLLLHKQPSSYLLASFSFGRKEIFVWELIKLYSFVGGDLKYT